MAKPLMATAPIEVLYPDTC